MGTVFSIYKRKPKERYELGKHFLGFRPGMEPEGIIAKMTALSLSMKVMWGSIRESNNTLETDELGKLRFRLGSLTDPGWHAMWSIMGTPDYSVFKMSRWSREELADKIWRASSNVDTPKEAMLVADHLLAWAGDADVTLNPEEPGDLAELGWPTRGYRDTGSLWDAFNILDKINPTGE